MGTRRQAADKPIIHRIPHRRRRKIIAAAANFPDRLCLCDDGDCDCDCDDCICLSVTVSPRLAQLSSALTRARAPRTWLPPGHASDAAAPVRLDSVFVRPRSAGRRRRERRARTNLMLATTSSESQSRRNP